MAAWRTLGVLVTTLAAARAQAQPYPLSETAQAGDCYRVHLAMTLAGEERMSKDGKPVVLKLGASATHDFAERVLNAGANGLVQRVARRYETATAAITAGSDRSERGLRPERRLLVAQRHPDPLVYCPAGPLTRAELELAGEHFDTLCVAGLLPGKAVGTGDTWKIGNESAQALCNFEGLTSHDLTGKLIEVKDNAATVAVTGTASGIDLGALVKLTVTATARYDLAAHRLVALEWKQKDERGQGPATPAATVETTTTLTRQPIAQPDDLSDVALISVPEGFEPPPAMTLLAYHHDGTTPFDLAYGRQWQVVGRTRDRFILRLLDRGDFVAQVTITCWEKARPGEHLSPAAFREAMAKTPGWEQAEVVQEGEVPSEGGRWVYRVSAPGTMDGLKVVQNFFLIAGPGGEQLVAAFTMTPAQAEKLGTRDLALVQGLSFPTPNP